MTDLDQRQATTTTGCDYYYYYYYWLGLDKVYRLMQLGSVTLRVEVCKLTKMLYHHIAYCQVVLEIPSYECIDFYLLICNI